MRQPADNDPVYQHLEVDRVRETVVRLHRRAAARFPDRGLTRVAAELVTLVDRVDEQTRSSQARVKWLERLAWLGMAVAVLLALTALVVAVVDVIATSPGHAVDWVPLVESGINNVVFVAIAVLFLWEAPERSQRGETLALLYRLRSLAHVVDMHQLTKEP